MAGIFHRVQNKVIGLLRNCASMATFIILFSLSFSIEEDLVMGVIPSEYDYEVFSVIFRHNRRKFMDTTSRLLRRGKKIKTDIIKIMHLLF